MPSFEVTVVQKIPHLQCARWQCSMVIQTQMQGAKVFVLESLLQTQYALIVKHNIVILFHNVINCFIASVLKGGGHSYARGRVNGGYTSFEYIKIWVTHAVLSTSTKIISSS